MPSVKDRLQCEFLLSSACSACREGFKRLEQATAHLVPGCRGGLGALEPEGAAGNQGSLGYGEKLQNCGHDLYTIKM